MGSDSSTVYDYISPGLQPRSERRIFGVGFSRGVQSSGGLVLRVRTSNMKP